MGYLKDFPYSSMYDSNLREMLAFVKKLEGEYYEILDQIKNELGNKITEYIKEHFNDYMLDVSYIPETETIVLKLADLSESEG